MCKEAKKNLIATLLLNIVILLIYLTFYNITYETNDEWAFSSFLSGAYGIRSSRLIFSNIFYGRFLRIFYSLDLGINWFTVFQIGFCFISFCVITFICLMKTKSYEKTCIRYGCAFVILLMFGFHHYYYIQWTKSACLVALAGILLIFYSIHHCKKNKWMLAVGNLLVLIGSFLRFDAVYIVLAYAFVRCIYDLLIAQKFEGIIKSIKKNKEYVIIFFCLLVLIFGFKYADKLMYKYGEQSEKWNYYMEYNKLRSELVDYGIPNYTQNLEAYENMGFSNTDITMLYDWCFSDSEVYNVDTLKKIVELKAEKKWTFSQILSTYENMVNGIKNKLGMLILFATIMFLIKSQRKQKVLFALYFSMTFLLYGYLTYISRLAFRIEYGIWLCLLTFFLYDYPEKEGNRSKILSEWSWLIMSVVLIFISVNDYKNNETVYTMQLQTQYRQLFDYTNAHKENLYMRDVFTLGNWSFGFSPLEALPYGYLSNICLLGGWEVENPITNVKDSYGIKNPWKECVDNPNVFIIDNLNISTKLEYIRQRYCPTAEAVLVDTVAGFNIYKIVSDIEE